MRVARARSNVPLTLPKDWALEDFDEKTVTVGPVVAVTVTTLSMPGLCAVVAGGYVVSGALGVVVTVAGAVKLQ